MKIAYADCFSGASGDMFLGALLDAGFTEQALCKQLAALGIDDYRLTVILKQSSGLRCTKVEIESTEKCHHRSWKTIRNLIKESGLSEPVQEKALTVFHLLATAEARVHGCEVDDVHFHEVGAMDSIIDIVGCAAGMDYLGIDHLITSPLPMPHGWVKCEHGMLPLPAPAVCEILVNVPVYGVDLDKELVTPTGAALIKGLSRDFGPFPPMTITSVGYGCGSRDLPEHRPNLLRLVIGEIKKSKETKEVEVIETNLDDWSPEGFPHISEQLFKLGALDVILIPVQMKKGRPGFMLQVISDPSHTWEIKKCILSETTSIGLRFHRMMRWTLPRETGTIETCFGKVGVKKVETPNGPVLYPEYEKCRKTAERHQVPLRDVYTEVTRCAVKDFVRVKA